MHSLIDIGANLSHTSFANDLSGVLARAQTQGVRQIIVTGASSSGLFEVWFLPAFAMYQISALMVVEYYNRVADPTSDFTNAGAVEAR